MSDLITKSKLPNLIIAGVTKAGTTSLFTYLKMHPNICASKVKETCYFLPVRYGTQMSPIQEYLENFNGCEDSKYIMEATPGYYYGGKKIAAAIKEATGDPYVIIVLREPISRMFSFYKYLRSRLLLPTGQSFLNYIDQCKADPSPRFESENYDLYWGIEGGYYDNYLEDWHELFGERLKIIFFEDMTANPREVLERLCNWLEIDSTVFNLAALETENRSVNYRYKQLQKLAIYINDKAEKFWRYFPRLKSWMRNIYYVFNGRDFEERITAPVRGELNVLFSSHNRRLAAQLNKMGYDKLPSWLIIDDAGKL